MAWDRVTRAVDSMNHRLVSAETEEDFQAVGLLGREALISLAQAVFQPEHHPSLDGVSPSQTDAKRMLEAFVAAVLAGSGNEEARRLVRSAVAFAESLQHRRSAQRIDAELAVAGVESAVRIVEVLVGHVSAAREPWQGVEIQGRYFAWSGPALHSLEDRRPVPTPAGLIDALGAAGMTPSYGMRDRLNHHLAQGGHQLFETDRRTWRRELLYSGDGRQILLVKTERK